MIRIGTIGSGFIVGNILENVAKTEGIVCEAVYSRKEETGRALADRFQVKKVYTDLDLMCQDPEIDFIYIASPNTLHYEQAKKALGYGKHVICEKPFTPCAAEAAELIALAKEKHLFLFEAITTLYHPNYGWIREHMKDIGELKMISCTFCQYSSRYDLLLDGEVTNIFNPEFAGGALMDINVYNIHFVIGLLGMPDRVEYFAGKYENGIDTHGIAVLQYGDVICQCTGSKDCHSGNGVQIMGDKGYISVSPMSSNCQDVKIVRRGMEDVTVSVEGDQWFQEIQTLTRVIQDQDYELCYQNLERTLEVVRVLEQARKSAGLCF